MHYARLGVGFWFRPWRVGAHVPERRGAAATRRFWRELLVSPYPRLRITPTVVSLTYKGFDIGYVVTDMPLVSAAKDIAVTTPVQAP